MDALLKVSAIRRTVDNITVVVIGFDNFVNKLEQFENSKAAEHPIIEELLMEPVWAPYLENGQEGQ